MSPSPSAEPREITGKDGAPMVLVPAGEFLYGDIFERNKQRLSLPAFYMDKYEVTTKLYAQFMQATGHKPPEFWSQVSLARVGDRPVMGVKWSDADAYCRYYGKRLPTEQEWEKAARGTDGRTYPWGNEQPSSSRFANFLIPPVAGLNRTGNFYDDRLAPVGNYEMDKSPYGIYDMAGNVREWTDSNHENTGRVLRGGAYSLSVVHLRSTKRIGIDPKGRDHISGFRCVLVKEADAQTQTTDVRPAPTPPVSEGGGSFPDEPRLNALVSEQRYGAITDFIRDGRQPSEQLTQWLLQKAEAGHVPLQFELSRQLSKANRAEAIKWFTIAHIGTALDAVLCEDHTARAAVGALTFSYRDVIAGVDKSQYEAAAREGLKWHDQHPKRPSAIWVCYHGMKAFQGSVELIPVDQWDREREKVMQSLSAAPKEGNASMEQQVSPERQQWKIKHVLQHDSSVFAVAMSPDGREVAAGGILSPDISIWDVERGAPIRQYRGLKGSAQAVAYSPDGRFFAAGRGMIRPVDTCVFVFQRGTENILQRLQPPKVTTRRNPKGVGAVESVRYSPDSQFLAVGFDGGAIGIYEATTGQLKKSIVIPDGLDGPLAYSPTGKYVAFGELKKDESKALEKPRVIQLLDVETGEIVKTFAGHAGRVTALAFSPDGRYLASGTSTGTVERFLDTKSNQPVRQQNVDPIRIWDIETGTLVKELSGHTGMIRFLAFYQGGQYLVSGSQDKALKIWDIVQGKLVTSLSGHNSLIEAGDVSLDGKYLVSGGGEFVKIWER